MSPIVAVEPRILQGEGGSPPSPFYLIVHRIADRLGPEFERAFLEHIERLQDGIDGKGLLRGLGVRRTDDVLAALGLSAGSASAEFRGAVRAAINRTMLASGTAVASATAAEVGIEAFTFDGARPRFALIAQRHAARLISQIDEETREAVRAIIARSFLDGLTTDDQARLIRQIVGLRKGHANAVANLRRQLRQAARLGPGAERDRLERLITRRRLDAVTKQRLRSAIRNGTITEELIDEVADTYTASLKNRRAKDIARTEGQHAANAGQQEAWMQAADDGLIDRKRARRVPIITPDERLRPSHAVIPGMNVGGVGLEEPFETPGGPAMHPPWPFEPYNCRCGVGLVFLPHGDS